MYSFYQTLAMGHVQLNVQLGTSVSDTYMVCKTALIRAGPGLVVRPVGPWPDQYLSQNST